MIDLREAKMERIALIRSDIRDAVAKLHHGPLPFDDTQIVVLDCFFNYFIDCIAELELRVERLEGGGGAVVIREVGVPDGGDSGGWDSPVMGRFRD